MDRNIFELSGGEKQQIACGSVYAALPSVIVMDEPSSNLDMESIRKLQKLIRMMKDEGRNCADFRASAVVSGGNR